MKLCHKKNNGGGVEETHLEEEVTQGANGGVLETLKAGTKTRIYTNVIYSEDVELGPVTTSTLPRISFCLDKVRIG